jgi:hypothetical protein
MNRGIRTDRALLAGATLLTSCALVACGGSSSGSSSASAGGSAQYKTAVKYARCMRTDGVSNFPDPKNPGGFSQAAINALNTSAPAYVSATTKCQKLLPNAGVPTSSQAAATLVYAIKVAKCERAHGINMPDPTLQPNSQLEFSMANVNNNAPDFH